MENHFCQQIFFYGVIQFGRRAKNHSLKSKGIFLFFFSPLLPIDTGVYLQSICGDTKQASAAAETGGTFNACTGDPSPSPFPSIPLSFFHIYRDSRGKTKCHARHFLVEIRNLGSVLALIILTQKSHVNLRGAGTPR